MKRARPEPNDAGLVAAFETATKDNYLGNPEVVETELRLLLSDILQAREKRQTASITEDEARDACNARMEKTARMMLGQTGLRPVVGWNQPGGIDEYVAKELNISEPDPVRRIILALWMLTKEICALVKQEEEGQPEENTRWQMEEAIAQMTRNFLGIPQPTDDEPTTPPEQREEEDDEDLL